MVAALVSERTSEIRAEIDATGTAWPVVEYTDIAAGDGLDGAWSRLRRRGCVVVRGHFEHEQALGWDRQIVDYVGSNAFFDTYRGPGDDFFDTLDSKPEIYPIYWSPAQMQARQSERMANVQTFLNSLWNNESDGKEWFEPDRNVMYPDRIRRRPEGTTSGGLATHIDAGTFDLWMKPEFQRAFRHVFDGSIEQFSPWDAAHRTDGSQYPSYDHDVGLPNVSGMDGAVGHGTRPRCAPHRSNPRSDRLSVVATSAERRGRRRHVWPRRRSSLPRLGTLACTAA